VGSLLFVVRLETPEPLSMRAERGGRRGRRRRRRRGRRRRRSSRWW
jgi:hypothetical protein